MDLTQPLSPERRREIRGWALLAIGSLAAAGVLALLLALSRTPGVQDWLPWGPTFFYRALIVHVVLSFQVWFVAAFGAMAALVTGGGRLARASLWLAVAGTVLIIIPALLDRGEPSLNNYVPVLVDPLFYAGLLLLASGLVIASVRVVPLIRSAFPVKAGIGAAGVIMLAACVCFGVAWLSIPAATERSLFNERLFWGGGHVLQIFNTVLLMVAWQALAERQFGSGPLPPALARAAFVALLLFAVAAPLIYAGPDVLGLAHRRAFTDLLWIGLPLPPLVMGAGLALLLIRRARDWSSPATLALTLSLAVFAIGGIAGFFLGVADTRTPSHYHAVIGGVNLGLMGVFLVFVLEPLGRTIEATKGRWVRAQFHLYGWGQLLHAVGFFLAGAAGVPRKATGVAQGLDSLGKKVAMGVVGLGGAVAVLGGIIFVWMVLVRLLAREGSGESC